MPEHVGRRPATPHSLTPDHPVPESVAPGADAVQPIEMQPFFLPGSAGDLFCLWLRPGAGTNPSEAVLFCPPFAEEMNKSRRMVALQARRLAEHGCSVLLVDVHGTGDSQGDFAAARWDQWRDDMQRALQWLRDAGAQTLTLWGLRLGALLAVQLAAAARPALRRIVLWQPVLRGDQHMTQFLRLRMAAEMTREQKLTTADLRAAAAAGRSIEVAGYEIAPELLAAVDGLDLAELTRDVDVPVSWLEVVPSAERGMTAASRRVIEAWRGAGGTVTPQTVVGEPFWSTPEISLVPPLLDVSTPLFMASADVGSRDTAAS